MCAFVTQITKDPKIAASFLKKGMVVALPTETVYGLGASIYQEKALGKIFTLKKRPQDNPLIVHALDFAMIERFAIVTEDFKKLYNAFMPGPLSVLLEAKCISDTITCGLSTVAVRVPASILFQEVLKELDEPIAAPSANLSGRPSSTKAEHVYDDFSPNLSLILDGGPSSGGIESTIVKLYADHGVILRPGLITKDCLEKVLGKPFIFADKNATLQAPGMKYRHYAPCAKVHLTSSLDGLKLREGVMIISHKKFDHAHYRKLDEATIYECFREADKLNLSDIYVEISGSCPEGLKNRLEKAAMSLNMNKLKPTNTDHNQH